MSYLTFPLTFNQIVGWPIKQTPRFNTIQQNPATGRSPIQIPTMTFPLWDFEIDIGYLPGDAQGVSTEYQQLINFYMGVQGAAGRWLFLHPYDNIVGSYTVAGTYTSGHFILSNRETLIQTSTGATATIISVTPTQLTIGPWNPAQTPDNSHTWVGQTSGAIFTPSAVPVLSTSQSIGTGDGSTTAFSMVRSLVSGGAQDLIQQFVYAPFIYVAGTLQTPTTNYTGPDTYGTITFTSGHIPTTGQNISWTGQFQYLCSFTADRLDGLEETFYQLWEYNGLRFHSVLL
jgi:hypothetical protein